MMKHEPKLQRSLFLNLCSKPEAAVAKRWRCGDSSWTGSQTLFASLTGQSKTVQSVNWCESSVKKQHTAGTGDIMVTGWALSLTSASTGSGKQMDLSQKNGGGVGRSGGTSLRDSCSSVEPDIAEDDHTGR